jgi:hypothetical protein
MKRKTYSSFKSWKAGIKKHFAHHNNVRIKYDGSKDICCAIISYETAGGQMKVKTFAEWDGVEGYIN